MELPIFFKVNNWHLLAFLGRTTALWISRKEFLYECGEIGKKGWLIHISLLPVGFLFIVFILFGFL
jgi:hypothetical protein